MRCNVGHVVYGQHASVKQHVTNFSYSLQALTGRIWPAGLEFDTPALEGLNINHNLNILAIVS